ncbi:MAG: TIGR00645 family protein [Blastochloris sp.]|nr:TIGR00645 family protein [Blastochloris sp.]
MLERSIEKTIFLSRWMMVPFYLGLLVSLTILVATFLKELWHLLAHALDASEADVILGILALIDLSLAANLVLIVVFSGYENFVSKIDAEGHPDWPDWMTKVDFPGLKQKLMGSIVAISAIQLLKAFMHIDTTSASTFNSEALLWLVVVHMVFVVSGVILAWTDRIGAGHGRGDDDSHGKNATAGEAH